MRKQKPTGKNGGKLAGAYLSLRQHEKLLRIAEKEGRTISAIVRHLLNGVIKAGASGIDQA
jgi:hypothetical protein